MLGQGSWYGRAFYSLTRGLHHVRLYNAPVAFARVAHDGDNAIVIYCALYADVRTIAFVTAGPS